MILNSIRLRITAASLFAIVAALFAANILIGNLFKEHVTKQFEATIQSQLVRLASLVKTDPQSEKLVLLAPAGEPRWSTPFSGLYWQIDLQDGQILRSRSLWDLALKVMPQTDQGANHFYYIEDFNKERLLALSKKISIDSGANDFILTVAADTKELQQAILSFQSSIQVYLFILALVLLAILFLQITFGLSPLASLKRALNHLQKGDSAKIEGDFPVEFNDLVNEFNIVLERNERIVSRAKTQAGNLAHAMKTPIAVISNALDDKNMACESFKTLVKDQIGKAKEQIDWNLAKARAATAFRNPQLTTAVFPVIESIVSVMNKVYADKELRIDIELEGNTPIAFNGEKQDLQEIVANLIDNSCKWAKSAVLISVAESSGSIQITFEDDGAGVLPQNYGKVLRRGFRVDELTQGSGLGLAIVDDLLSLYEGSIALGDSRLGGLKVSVRLPSSK